MKTLIIIAHPNPWSFSHAMAFAYQQSHPDATVLDLYQKEHTFFSFEKHEELTDTQKLIQTHDELAFFFPVWRGSMPAILKNFFDVEFASGFAFQYESGKRRPKKLLKGKTAKVFCTCDAPSIIYHIPVFGISIGRYFRYALLGYCGIHTTTYKLFGNLRKRTDQERKKILETIKQS